MIDFAINLYGPDRVIGYERHIIHCLVTIINGEAVLYIRPTLTRATTTLDVPYTGTSVDS